MSRAKKREEQPWLRYVVLPTFLILFGLLISVLILPRPIIAPSDSVVTPTPTPTPTLTPNFCGGIAGISCPVGYNCRLDGSYPDAGGQCVLKKGYVCPQQSWVDCMPGPRPRSPQCASDFLTWAKASCPGFEGAAY